MDDARQDELDDAMLGPSEEQIRRELLEASADIAAGRVVPGEVVLAELQQQIDDYLKKRASRHGEAIG
jgi:hypothetical protein